IALSTGAGPVGVFLSALGPWGVAAAVGLGAVSAAFNKLVEMAHEAGQKARELRDFADNTGLSINQLKQLDALGASLGISSDKVATGIERLTVSMDDVRRGTGGAYEKLLQLNPELAQQLALSRTSADAVNLLARSFDNLDKSQQ